MTDPMDNDIPGIDPIISEAKRRFKRAQEWESRARSNFIDDLKFAEGDAVNGYQWPNDLLRNRDIDARPSLTINKTRGHNLQIINDAKQNKPGVAIRPVGNGATYESAQMLEGVVRHIEYISNAQVAYDTATEFQVKAGLGYWRVVTDYCNDDTFDQEIFIRRIKDPLSVYADPDAKEFDKSDSTFYFIFDDIPREVFDKKYPDYVSSNTSILGADNGDDWINRDQVRIAEYFRAVKNKDRYVLYTDPTTGDQRTIRGSKLPKDMLDKIIDDPMTQTREVELTEIEWFLIVGEEIKERKKWPGKYIPVVPVIGEESVIDGHMDRKGHTRAMLDPQRMLNFWASGATEFVALQSKTPYMAPAAAIEGYETFWESANKDNHAVLPYNHLGDDGQPIPPPQRQQPPIMAPAYVAGLQMAAEQMMMVSGQYQSSMGATSNERSGKAINERQRQGDLATYHYTDHLAIAIRFTGKILIDLIPHIYDTARILRIQAEDGTDIELQIDPKAQQSYQIQLAHDQTVAKHILNPSVGKYDVQADVGPGYGTKRQQAFDAISTVISQAPQLMSLVGDLLFQSADFPNADQVARRLKRMVPPQALGQGPSQQEQQLMQMVKVLQGQIAELTQAKLIDEIKLKGKDEMRDIDTYKAETDRMKVIKGDMTVEERLMLVTQLVNDATGLDLSSLILSNQGGPASAVGSPGGLPQSPSPVAPPGLPQGVRLGADGRPYMHNFATSPSYTPIGNALMGAGRQ